MRVLLQRVSRAAVSVDSREVACIGRGYLLLVGIGIEDESDDGAKLEAMAHKILDLRIMADERGRMNRSIAEIATVAADSGRAMPELLVISQFTLHADCRRGRRPSFTAAAKPEVGRRMFEQFVDLLGCSGLSVRTGVFGAMMEVSSVNDGPVTIWLDSAEIVK